MTTSEYYKNRKPVKKLDVIIILVVFFVVIASFFFLMPKRGNSVLVYENGVLYGKYSLGEYQTVEMSHCSFRINKDGVTMILSDCQNQICVHTGSIDAVHQVIVCAPNKIVLVIVGESKYDAITGGEL